MKCDPRPGADLRRRAPAGGFTQINHHDLPPPIRSSSSSAGAALDYTDAEITSKVDAIEV
jgi:hypothetical protein